MSDTPSPREIEILPALLAGLNVHSVDVHFQLDQPSPLRPLATATVRGLLGHLLTAASPTAIRRWFKPGHEGHLPAPYLFEAVSPEFSIGCIYPFRLRSWEPSGELLPAFMHALAQAPGRPFGESGGLIKQVDFAPVEIFGSLMQPGPASLEFLTPLRLKSGSGWVAPEDLALGHLVEASVRRLNLLSTHYGNQTALVLEPWLVACAKVRETGRDLRWISPRRRSSSQGIDLALSGIVGSIRFSQIPSMLVQLLQAAALFHAGHKTTEGCGHFRLTG